MHKTPRQQEKSHKKESYKEESHKEESYKEEYYKEKYYEEKQQLEILNNENNIYHQKLQENEKILRRLRIENGLYTDFGKILKITLENDFDALSKLDATQQQYLSVIKDTFAKNMSDIDSEKIHNALKIEIDKLVNQYIESDVDL